MAGESEGLGAAESEGYSGVLSVIRFDEFCANYSLGVLRLVQLNLLVCVERVANKVANLFFAHQGVSLLHILEDEHRLGIHRSDVAVRVGKHALSLEPRPVDEPIARTPAAKGHPPSRSHAVR